MDREIPVLAFTGYERIAVVDLPELKPKVMSFECVDPRKCKAMRSVSKHFGINKGELFPYKTPGGINDLLYGTESVKAKCFEFIELGHQFGVRDVWIVSHTCCAADKKKFGEMTSGDDVNRQEQKLLAATGKILDFSKQRGFGLQVLPIFFNMTDGQGQIITLKHGYVDHTELEGQGNILAQAVQTFAAAA